jgi:hypothetical protein
MIKMRNKFLLKNLKGRNHLEDLGIDGRIKSKLTGWESVNWIHMD